MGKLSNWPMVLVMPSRNIQAGVLALGAYIAMTSNNPLSLGGLIGFMMLGGRITSPYWSIFARLLQDIQEDGASALPGRLGTERQPGSRGTPLLACVQNSRARSALRK